jgi:hypothetical protein
VHGPVRVDKDAKAGKAILRVELLETSKHKSIPTDVEVELVEG